MPANTQPIFPSIPKTVVGASVATANTNLDGTGTVTLLFTAGLNGSFIEDIRIMHKGTNVATVVRIFLNNGSTPVAANNSLWYEVSLLANTLSQAANSLATVISLNKAIPAGYCLYASTGTVLAAGFALTVTGGDY